MPMCTRSHFMQLHVAGVEFVAGPTFCAGAQLSDEALDIAGAHVVYALEGNSGGCVGLRGWTLGDQTLTDVSWFFLLFQRHLCGPQVVHTQCLALHWAGLPEPHENA